MTAADERPAERVLRAVLLVQEQVGCSLCDALRVLDACARDRGCGVTAVADAITRRRIRFDD